VNWLQRKKRKTKGEGKGKRGERIKFPDYPTFPILPKTSVVERENQGGGEKKKGKLRSPRLGSEFPPERHNGEKGSEKKGGGGEKKKKKRLGLAAVGKCLGPDRGGEEGAGGGKKGRRGEAPRQGHQFVIQQYQQRIHGKKEKMGKEGRGKEKRKKRKVGRINGFNHVSFFRLEGRAFKRKGSGGEEKGKRGTGAADPCLDNMRKSSQKGKKKRKRGGKGIPPAPFP